MKDTANTSILVIDDEEIVRDNIEEILVPRKASAENLSMDLAASILFDSALDSMLAPRTTNIPNFTVHKASNGMEGLEMVKKSISDGCPYAVIFLDMRMPGWDGMETAEQIRKYDSKAEIIFVTAFSDRSIDDIIARAGQNVGYHCKPYASEEITQLATKAVTDYNKLRNLEKLIEAISSISLDEQHLTSLLRNILDQLATYVDTDMALLGKLQDDYSYEKIFAIGPVDENINLNALIILLKSAPLEKEQVMQMDDVVFVRLDNYTIFAVLKKKEKLKTEQLYLLRLFVLNAAKAIHNAELRQKLIRKEKLSAVGNAVSMMMHDLRSPIKNINVITEMMRADFPGNEMLEMIDECGVQASAIFEDFMDFINETPVKKLPVSVDKMIQDGINLTETRNINGKVIVFIEGMTGLTVEGDESKLKRTIMNLVNNSIDVLIDLKISNPVVHINVRNDQASKTVLIRVNDNGPGVPAEIIKTLFEPFITCKKANGTGLGLSIVKQYIEAHGGNITVHNEDGAVFTIILPAKN